MAEMTGITTEQWQDVVSRLREDERITNQLLGFVNLISVQGVLGETLYLQVANEMTRGIIEQRIKQPLLETLSTVGLDEAPTNIGIVVNPELTLAFTANQQADLELEEEPETVVPVYSSADSSQPTDGSSRLNPRYTFESFNQHQLQFPIKIPPGRRSID